MLRYVFFIVAVSCVVAWYAPQALKAGSGAQASQTSKTATAKRQAPRRTKVARAEQAQVSSGRKVRLKKGRGGHYNADVRVNGRKFNMLIDTGASYIALTARDAKRMGVYPPTDQFIYKTQTANGIARVAIVTLKEVKIGGIRVNNVRATVHKGRGLDTNLLGMSFLNRLSKFNFKGDTLTMVN